MRIFGVITIFIAILAIAIAAGQKAIQVSIDGKVVSSRGLLKDGVVYVRLDDLAKASGKSYSFDRAKAIAKVAAVGGTFQADGVEGMAGAFIDNGISRLKVATAFNDAGAENVLEIEVRNAEKQTKDYNFGFTVTKYTLFDSNGNAVEGTLIGSEMYSVGLAQAEFRKLNVKFRFPAGYAPTRLVIRLQTQISGKPPRSEIFRVNF